MLHSVSQGNDNEPMSDECRQTCGRKSPRRCNLSADGEAFMAKMNAEHAQVRRQGHSEALRPSGGNRFSERISPDVGDQVR